MSFVRINNTQLKLTDPLFSLTEREHKFLKNSWTQYFGDCVFPKINQGRFRVLYSDNPAIRPNNLANIYVGMLMLKELFALSDEECLGHFVRFTVPICTAYNQL